MKRLFWRLAPEMVLCLTSLGLIGGCSESISSVPPGPPVLLSFSVIDNATGAPLDLTSDGAVIQVSGFVHLNAIFDRLLDPISVTALDGGVDNGTDVVSGSYAPALPVGSSVTLTSIYTPNGDPVQHLVFSAGPSITTMASPTFPSNSTVTVQLDKTRIRSKKGDPFTGDGNLASGQLVFHTLPFDASITVPMADPDPDAGADAGTPPVAPMMQAATIGFTNVPGSDIATHVTVTANGTAFTDVVITTGGSGATAVDVAPNTTWPPNATIVITVDATATDAVGVAIDAAASASFTTSGS